MCKVPDAGLVALGVVPDLNSLAAAANFPQWRERL
jgi:hypothetical protein